jgi:hypothetical protein
MLMVVIAGAPKHDVAEGTNGRVSPRTLNGTSTRSQKSMEDPGEFLSLGCPDPRFARRLKIPVESWS